MFYLYGSSWEPDRWTIGILSVTFLVVLLTVFTDCDPFDTRFDEIEKAERYSATELKEPRSAPEELKVMTWNVKFGGGRIRFFFECPGDRVIMERDEVVGNLERVAEKIRQVDPDVLLLQEVDVESKRVANIDQVQWLLDRTELNYGVYASQWRASWIPSRGLGHIDSGNAILSKWPFERATRIALPLISSQWFWTRYFYLKRNLLKTRLEIPGVGPLYVLNTHLSAFSKDGTRARQLDEVKTELAELTNDGHSIIFGGDLNLIPPGSETTKNFADVECSKEDFEAADYSDKLELLQPLYDGYTPAISLDAYRASNRPYLTYSGREEVFWTRKLDYLFTNRRFRDGLTHQNEERGGMKTLHRSDHAPVTATYVPPGAP